MPHVAKISCIIMEIKRDYYLKQLIERQNNGLIKVITGIRRCGKSYLLFKLFYKYLINKGVDKRNIIKIALDEASNAKYRNPLELDKYIREITSSDENKKYYILLDEIQFVKEIENPWLPNSNEIIGFIDVLLGLMKIENADIYVTGSNSTMLSSDIVTQFRDKGDEIKIYPLAFSEYVTAFNNNYEEAWRNFYTYGGLPRTISFSSHKNKYDYLDNLFSNTYLKDVIERHNIKNDKSVLDKLIRIIASSVGSLSNPKKLSDTLKSVEKLSMNPSTIELYLDYFIEAFIIGKAFRYNVKGKKYFDTPLKYYFTDVGLRNALLGFRQQEENHIMENIIYNELLIRGYSIDVGVVEYRYRDANKKEIRSQLEVDFIARNGGKNWYIQSALNVDTEEKRLQETNSLVRIPDSFTKTVVVKDHIIPWTDEKGIEYIGIRDFLLNK